MTKIRISHALSSNDLLDPSPLSQTGPSYLESPLPARAGPRPKIMSRIMPQRQRPEHIEPTTHIRLQSLMQKLAMSHPELVEVKLSHTEGKSTDGLYAREDLPTLNPIAKDRILNHVFVFVFSAVFCLFVWLCVLVVWLVF